MVDRFEGEDTEKTAPILLLPEGAVFRDGLQQGGSVMLLRREVDKARLGASDPNVAEARHSLAVRMLDEAWDPECEPEVEGLFRRTLEIKEGVVGPRNVYVGEGPHAPASCFREFGRGEETIIV